jgi:thioredoxin-related protein
MKGRQAGLLQWLVVLMLLLSNTYAAADAFPVFKHSSQLQQDRVLVLVAEIENCSFCQRVKQNFLQPLTLDPHWDSRFQVARLDLNSYQTVTDFTGKKTSQQAFLETLGANFSPTLMFLDPRTGERIGEDIIGLVTPDFYGFYLQQQIALAYQRLHGH